jgi:ketosteroid isomerase-like protein
MRSNADALWELWDAWSAGRAREVLALLHPDVEWSPAPDAPVLHGREAVAAWLEALRASLKSVTVTLEQAEDAGPGVVVARGSATGFDYGGGPRADVRATLVAEYEGGLLVRGRTFTDDEQLRGYLASRAAG